MTFENTITGITHTAMRQTCEGVALGSRTLTARIQELLKKHVTIRNAGIGDDSVEPRSVKTLIRVCVLGMHLMTKDPPSHFFTCPTCQPFISTPTNAILRPKMNAVCVEGIWLGSQSHLSEPCTNIAASCRLFSGTVIRKARPRSSLTRMQTNSVLLMNALKGKRIEVSEANFPSFCAVLRILQDDVLPPGFFEKEYIYGQHPKDSSSDVGKNSTLCTLRSFLSILFDVVSIRNSLLSAVLQQYVNHRLRRKSERWTSLVSHLRLNVPDFSPEVRHKISQVGPDPSSYTFPFPEPNGSSDIRKGMLWGPDTQDMKEFQKVDIFNLLTVIVEGPLPNVAKHEQLHSMKELIKMLREYNGLSLDSQLRDQRESKTSFWTFPDTWIYFLKTGSSTTD